MSLDDVHKAVTARLDAKHRAREVGLSNARQAIRRCANAIRAVHRGERGTADRLLVEARDLLDVAEATLAAHPDVYYAGFVQDAQKEYAEALAARALVAGEIIERTRSDLTLTVIQRDLADALRRRADDAGDDGSAAG